MTVQDEIDRDVWDLESAVGHLLNRLDVHPAFLFNDPDTIHHIRGRCNVLLTRLEDLEKNFA